jgi:hypothetical protein
MPLASGLNFLPEYFWHGSPERSGTFYLNVQVLYLNTIGALPERSGEMPLASGLNFLPEKFWHRLPELF